MAGGGSLGGGGKTKRGKASKRKKMKRVGFHLDMTPLVDITFLLLTFFMFTTTMATPQVMEMSVPPEESDVEVRESELYSILLDNDGKFYYYLGNDAVEKVDLKSLKEIAIRENIKQKNRLITVFKVAPEAPYGLVINTLDMLNLAEVNISEEIMKMTDENGLPLQRKRKFTISDMTEDDFKKIEEIQ